MRETALTNNRMFADRSSELRAWRMLTRQVARQRLATAMVNGAVTALDKRLSAIDRKFRGERSETVISNGVMTADPPETRKRGRPRKIGN